MGETSKSAHTYSETSFGKNGESVKNFKSTKSTAKNAHIVYLKVEHRGREDNGDIVFEKKLTLARMVKKET